MAERRNATETYVLAQTGLLVPKSLYDANSVLAATADDTPAAVTMAASTILARLASGNIKAASVAEIATLLAPSLPGYEFGYDQITAPVTVSATVESAGNTVISCAAHTFDGAPVMAEFFSPYSSQSSSGFNVVSLFEGATQIGRLVVMNPGSTQGVPIVGSIRFTPTAGSHTYTVTAYRITANGTISAGAGGTGTQVPAYIRFTKV